MNAAALAQIINAAFSIIAGARRFLGSTDEINERLARVDAGGEAITVAEIQAKQNEWQSAIDAGRDL